MPLSSSEIREVLRDIEVPRYVTAEPAASPVFSGVADDQLLDYGVPAEWLGEVKEVTDEDALLEVADHLPAEAAEALLALATGTTPERPARVAPDADPFAHPDAQRRFRVMANQEELQGALEYPWEKWTVFLHPGAAASCGTELQRAGARIGVGRYRQDHRGAAPRRPPGACSPGRPRPS